jgi:hypothetical protein
MTQNKVTESSHTPRLLTGELLVLGLLSSSAEVLGVSGVSGLSGAGLKEFYSIYLSFEALVF